MADTPTHFQSLSLQQIIRADQEMFLLLASEYSGPLKSATVDGDPPLDGQIRLYMTDPRINMYLVPAPASVKRPAPASGHNEKPVSPPAKKAKQGPKVTAQLPAELVVRVAHQDFRQQTVVLELQHGQGMRKQHKEGQMSFWFSHVHEVSEEWARCTQMPGKLTNAASITAAFWR